MLYQLSYAPRLRGGLYPRCAGITGGVSGDADDNPETNRRADDDLLEQQEGKGYGDDEGERDDALADEDEQ